MTHRRIPQHCGGLKYSTGQAVLVLHTPANWKGTLTTTTGVITGIASCFAIVETAGRRRRIQPLYLYHRGHCPACQLAAHLDAAGALVCPRCGGPAATPLPDQLLPVWGEPNWFSVELCRVMLATGCTREAAWHIVWARKRRRELDQAA